MTLREATAILKAAGIYSPEVDARLIFREFSGLAERELYLPEAHSESERLIEAVRRRAEREPLQYIIGRVGFYREEYIVSEDALIPRADTEHLVDYALKHLPSGARFIDICTGTGCIAISTLRNTKDTTALAVDISEAALALAERNAEKNGVADRLELKRVDILTEGESIEGEYDAVISNPPYVTSAAYEALEPEIFREPKIAFVGGEDGMVFYRAITRIAKKLIKSDGFIAYEIGYDQGKAITALAKENGLLAEIIRDWSGNDRVAVLTFPKENS